MVTRVVIYATAACPYCRQAEALLRERGAGEIEKIRIDLFPDRLQEMVNRTGRKTVPQVFIDATHVGGHDDLVRLDRAGGLSDWLHTGAPPGTGFMNASEGI